MRKIQKKKLESLIETMWGVQEEVCKALQSGKRGVARELLADCQDGAVSMGTVIEQSEGEGFSTVGLLEEYCELVYQIYESIPQGDIPQEGSWPAKAGGGKGKASAGENPACADVARIRKSLKKQLTRVENSVQRDIKVRTEAVFLPYKASMWDSLESVWKAADADPDCDAYVIPIPYYDKNPDGTLGEMHDERDLYPDDVPVMDYKSYDFAARRPDMIFIHNPYDSYNYVTSVHPFFYSANLKKYTDKLVYIPYFILGEIDPENEGALEGMEHFATAPGVLHADQVIVQSEAIRQAYINILVKHAGEKSRKLWEKKILGLGSPKVDKVLAVGKEDFEIPESWDGLMRKKDGSFKRLIFYNTGVGALLNHGVHMLEKIKDVFGVFRKSGEDVVLLWRPHPLLEATIKSMRPELWEGYESLVQQYRTEGWGIYDDSADLNRAIAVSDAYYGDPSSIMELFKKVGKPVMLQNVDVLNGDGGE